MPLNMNTGKLEGLMKSFYTLTHIKIVIIDDNFNEVLAYPKTHNAFCAMMYCNEVTKNKCIESTMKLCKKCRQQGSLIVDRCHTGLTEAVAPLRENGLIIGYMMFGQITDIKERHISLPYILEKCKKYGLTENDIEKNILETRYKSHAQIAAAAEIMNACTNYILLEQMVTVKEKQFIAKMVEYIDTHLADDLTIEQLSHCLGVSKTRLYEITKQYMDGKIAAYIRERRMDQAAILLKTTDLSVSEISEKVGFTDYNYFCRSFKKHMKMPAKVYRKENDILSNFV